MNRLQDTTNFLKTYHQHFQIVLQLVEVLSQVGLIIRENASAHEHVMAISQILYGQYHIWNLFAIHMF
jgi:hypothetical protein